MVTEIGTLLDRDPRIRGGRPKIAGTGITVMRIVIYYQSGMTPDEISQVYPHVNLAQVHAALAYYHANRQEIDSDIAEDRAAWDEIEAQSVPSREH